MISNLERNDWIFIGVGIVLAIAAAVAGQQGILGLQAELLLGQALVIPIIPALIFLYYARDLYTGEIQRYLDFVGIGLLVNLIIFVPHLQWHIAAMGPGSLASWGLSPNFWYVFFHMMSAYSFLMISYGFYLLYKSGTS